MIKNISSIYSKNSKFAFAGIEWIFIMAPIANSDSAEDSQSRQLPINKKLTKAISAVPRSRFIKPRPNLPGSKRPDSSSAISSASKPV